MAPNYGFGIVQIRILPGAPICIISYARLAQLARAPALHAEGRKVYEGSSPPPGTISKLFPNRHLFVTIVLNSVNMKYWNAGDWVENRTAIVEHFDGKMEILTIEKDL